MTNTKTLVTVLVSIAVFASPVIAPSPIEVPVQESEEEKEQRIEEVKALAEELFKTCDKDNNDALSLDEYVDVAYELMVMQAEKLAPPDVDLSTPEFAEEHVKRQIKEGLEPEWGELGTDENGEIPKQHFFQSFLGQDYEDKEASTHSEGTNLSGDEEGIDSSDKQEPVSNEPRQTDTETR